MYIANSDHPIQGPHQQEKTIVTGKEPEYADAAMILVHGRGASADSILTLVSELDNTENMHFAAPQANGYTWYPYSFLMSTEQNEPGISSGLDRKSTRLNSSHVAISYAVFCLKKKKMYVE